MKLSMKLSMRRSRFTDLLINEYQHVAILVQLSGTHSMVAAYVVDLAIGLSISTIIILVP